MSVSKCLCIMIHTLGQYLFSSPKDTGLSFTTKNKSILVNTISSILSLFWKEKKNVKKQKEETVYMERSEVEDRRKKWREKWKGRWQGDVPWSWWVCYFQKHVHSQGIMKEKNIFIFFPDSWSINSCCNNIRNYWTFWAFLLVRNQHPTNLK